MCRVVGGEGYMHTVHCRLSGVGGTHEGQGVINSGGCT